MAGFPLNPLASDRNRLVVPAGPRGLSTPGPTEARELGGSRRSGGLIPYIEGVPIMARLRIRDDEPIPYQLTQKALDALAADQASQERGGEGSGKS